MTTISAVVIADSINEQGNRLTTMRLRYPRWIHAEGRTHRLLRIGEEEPLLPDERRTPSLMEDPNLSRNAASSRAIPVHRMIQSVLDDPAEPLYWGKNQPGMQASEELTGAELEQAKFFWRSAMQAAILHAKMLAEIGAHKQIVNRVLEPFMHIEVLVSATEWTNFFALRMDKAAEPHICWLAHTMYSAMLNSVPKLLRPGEWHLPFVAPDESARLHSELIRLSVARCAHLSYETAGDGVFIDKAMALRIYEKLVGSKPMHASPAEHQATPDRYLDDRALRPEWANPALHGNFKGWQQFRKMLPGESA